MTEPTLTHEVVVRVPDSLHLELASAAAMDRYLRAEITEPDEFYAFVKQLEGVASRLLAL